MKSALRSSAVVLLVVLSSRAALAQAQPQVIPPPPPPPVAPVAPMQTPEEEARAHFTVGVNLLQDPAKPRWELAYAEFKSAYALVPSYKILGNIALCAMNLERDSEAIDAYTRYLSEAKDLDPAERVQAERDLATLQATLARVTIESHPDGAVIQDVRVPARGDSVTNIYASIIGKSELGLRRGHHVIKARWPDGAEAAWELDLNGGESHVFEHPVASQAPGPTLEPVRPSLSPELTTSRPVPKSVFIVGGATLLVGAGSVIVGVLAVDTHASYNEANHGNDVNHATDLRSTGQTYNVVADVLLGATIVGAVATTYLYLARPTVSTTSARVVPTPRGFEILF